MRIRTIKPGFFRSHDVSKLSYRARLTWVGLWTYVDDEGRGLDDARIIKGDLWTLEDEVTWREVEEDLMELSLSGHVVRYEVNGRRFLMIPKWLDHQVISRPSKSKFPAPNPATIREEEHFTEDSVSVHGANTAGRGTGNREREEEKERELSLVATKPNLDELFESAWSRWPKKVDRSDARKRFGTASKKMRPDVLVDRIVDFGDAYSATTEKQFVPALGSWLHRERWTDELPSAPRPRGGFTPEERARQTLTLATDLDLKELTR